MEIIKIRDELLGSNCYIVSTNDKKAVVIDPNNAMNIEQVLFEKNFELVYIILTHEHYDHICGLEELRKNHTQAKVVASKVCSESISDFCFKKSRYELYLYFMGVNIKNVDLKPIYPNSADVEFLEEMQLTVNDCNFKLKFTPGHSPGSIIIILNDRYIFSGDSILMPKDIIVKLSGGNLKVFTEISVNYFKTLDKNLIVNPGHGESFLLIDKLNAWLDN